MKNLPLWTKTLAVASLTAFGAVACDGGGGQDTADVGDTQQDNGYAQEQDMGTYDQQEDDSVAQEQNSGFGRGTDPTLQEDEVDLYGQQGGTTGGQDTQTDEQLTDETDMGETGDDRVAQDY